MQIELLNYLFSYVEEVERIQGVGGIFCYLYCYLLLLLQRHFYLNQGLQICVCLIHVAQIARNALECAVLIHADEALGAELATGHG